MSSPIGRRFTPLAQAATHWTGSPYAFLLAALLVIVWAATGPLFGFSATWQLVINTSTTIATFLMVFLIQHATNAGDAATHLKLDALLQADSDDSDVQFVGIEDLTEPELAELKRAMREQIDQIQARRQPQ